MGSEMCIRDRLNCTCHPDSAANRQAGNDCRHLDAVVGSWVHRDPFNESYPAITCDQGPFIVVARSLAVLKSSPQLAMHLHDQAAPISCAEQGFPERFPPVAHCYPPMHIYTKAPIENDAGMQECETAERRLTCNYTATPEKCTTGFMAFADSHSIRDVSILNNNLGCNCLSWSTAAPDYAAMCWSVASSNAPHSPVRDWWDGEH